MAKITIRNLSFHYEGSHDDIFTNLSFNIDTDWKLGFIARNGRGKTTLMNLMAGKYAFQGEIDSPTAFSYFPFDIPDEDETTRFVIRETIAPFQALEQTMAQTQDDPTRLEEYATALDEYLLHDGYTIDSLIEIEAGKLDVAPGALDRPFSTLSQGEKTKLMLAALFLRGNHFLLIDEPTNHLDMDGRRTLAKYLAQKKGFILVSHDRSLLDSAIDHVITIERSGEVRIAQGNYSTWKQNKDLQDAYEIEQNQLLKKQISRLSETAREKANWSDNIEKTKIGTHSFDRGHVGRQAARMMKRSKVIERRVENAIEEKSALLKNIEEEGELKLFPLAHVKNRLITAEGLRIDYGSGPLFAPLDFELMRGQRLCVRGKNGSGKSSLIKLILGQDIPHSGRLQLATNMEISYVNQETSHLHGSCIQYALANGLDQSLFLTILRKLGFERVQFEKNIEEFSQGQKKKVLLAASLCQRAHLYIWDEPLNYIDLLSREQIEALLLKYQPTMIFIEHDEAFANTIATDLLQL